MNKWCKCSEGVGWPNIVDRKGYSVKWCWQMGRGSKSQKFARRPFWMAPYDSFLLKGQVRGKRSKSSSLIYSYSGGGRDRESRLKRLPSGQSLSSDLADNPTKSFVANLYQQVWQVLHMAWCLCKFSAQTTNGQHLELISSKGLLTVSNAYLSN